MITDALRDPDLALQAASESFSAILALTNDDNGRFPLGATPMDSIHLITQYTRSAIRDFCDATQTLADKKSRSSEEYEKELRFGEWQFDEARDALRGAIELARHENAAAHAGFSALPMGVASAVYAPRRSGPADVLYAARSALYEAKSRSDAAKMEVSAARFAYTIETSPEKFGVIGLGSATKLVALYSAMEAARQEQGSGCGDHPGLNRDQEYTAAFNAHSAAQNAILSRFADAYNEARAVYAAALASDSAMVLAETD